MNLSKDIALSFILLYGARNLKICPLISAKEYLESSCSISSSGMFWYINTISFVVLIVLPRDGANCTCFLPKGRLYHILLNDCSLISNKSHGMAIPLASSVSFLILKCANICASLDLICCTGSRTSL